ncbi:hypothetical protein [Nonomuraea polychroma]|uniref:hypothetical protein n=1 Tax=Nonomuraea polychroma TaxID=46176 RepID=UPI000FDD52E0|nr:hypothetical protein [Nonomuraea polychroma]
MKGRCQDILPDTPANLEEFPKDSAGGYETAFAQARVVAISECASHVIVAADASGCWDGEQTLAYSLYERLEQDMLLLAPPLRRTPPDQ